MMKVTTFGTKGTQCGSYVAAEAYYLKIPADPLYEKKLSATLF